MEQNGINLSEMNMILLKKVDELTAMLIEQRKMNDDQNQAIKLLKDQMLESKTKNKMKNIIVLVLLTITQTGFAQWNTSGTHIYNSNSGNIGIGTMSPQWKLDVAGLISSNGQAVINVATNEISVGDVAGSDGYRDKLHFHTRDQKRVTIDENGNVGIGTTSPISRLSVVIPVSTSTIGGDPNSYGAYFTDNINGTLAIRSLGSGAIHLTTDGASRKIILGGGNFEQTLFINGGGKIGIGSTASNPTTPLSLGTNIVSRLLSLYDANSDWYGFGIQGNQMRLQVGNSNARFSFFAGDNSEIMTVQGSGNIGIGTTSPTQKLTVNGTVYSKEVKVDLNVPGPDYVFEKDYKLPSLEVIKSYVDQHKHLPEVPSAKEMEQNGINLSEMNMILLKKVEELTLMLIEQKKMNDDQNQAIKLLKDQMLGSKQK